MRFFILRFFIIVTVVGTCTLIGINMFDKAIVGSLIGGLTGGVLIDVWLNSRRKRISEKGTKNGDL